MTGRGPMRTAMTRKHALKDPTPEEMKEAEREVGRNIPEEMVGLDSGDVGDDEGRR